MAGATPCLPAVPDSPIALSATGNELRTALIIDGWSSTKRARPADWGPGNAAIRSGGNPMRQDDSGVMVDPLPFARTFQNATSGSIRTNQPLTAGQTVNFPWNALTLSIPNPSPYVWEGVLNISATLYTFGFNPQSTFKFYVYQGVGTTISPNGHYAASNGAAPSYQVQPSTMATLSTLILPSVKATVTARTTGSITIHTSFTAFAAGTPTQYNGINMSAVFQGNCQ